MRGQLLIEPEVEALGAPLLAAGGHLVVLTSSEDFGIAGRVAGLELRDTLLVVSEGPRSRFAFLFRKPFSEATVVEQILSTGSGGLNVDACRIATTESLNGGAYAKQGADRSDGYEAWRYKRLGGAGEFQQPLGRWPPNAILVHGSECRNMGTKRARATSIHGTGVAIRRSGVHTEAGGHQTIGREQPVRGYADENGHEMIPSWDCGPCCPVRLLDEQTGDRPSTLTGRADPSKTHVNPGDNGGASLFGGGNSNVYADSGGASRFYPQMANEAELAAWLKRLIGVE